MKTKPHPAPRIEEVQKYLRDKLSASETTVAEMHKQIVRVCIALMTDEERGSLQYDTLSDLGPIIAEHAEKMREQSIALREVASFIPELIEFNDRLLAENEYLRQQLERK